MKVWIVTFSDGFEFSGVFDSVFDNEIEAFNYCRFLNDYLVARAEGFGYSSFPDASYDVEEAEMNRKNHNYN